MDRFEQKIAVLSEQVTEYLERLSPRERVMVVCTAVFVIIASIGSALWYMHQAAAKQQERVQELNDLIVWMQTNAVTMKPVDEMALSLTDKIQQAAQSQGLSVSAQENNGKVQIVVTHENYVVLANFLTKLAESGLSIEKMELVSEGGKIKLVAAVG